VYVTASVLFVCLCSKTSASVQSKLSADATVFEPKQQAEFQSEVIFELIRYLLLYALNCISFFLAFSYMLLCNYVRSNHQRQKRY